jgi:2-polyprenyl-6-methoxyphenol hydroxylase-like FAD-dependent oxidoreductase
MEQQNIPVFIVGGSLVGLSAAVFLADKKVPCILIEKHSGSSKHPRAVGFPERTMEIFKSVGIEKQIPQIDEDFSLKRVVAESLDGKWISETEWTPKDLIGEEKDNDIEYSPCRGAAIAQDKLEPILRKRALELGADLRFGTELLHFEQNEEEVISHVKERNSGDKYKVKSKYIIAADGNKSPVREALQIDRKGIGKLRIMRSVLFKAPLDEYLQSGVSQFEIEQSDLKAFLTTYRDGRWVLMFKDDIERNEGELLGAIHAAIGRKDISVEIITTGRWDLSALIAEKFKEGRIFLVGDAAHTLPPTRGGFGANTGIHDAHNLAWKLAAVHAEVSVPSLLDTYHPERQPVSWVRYQQTFARPDYSKYVGDEEFKDIKIYDDVSMELGQIYRSEGIIGADESLPDAMRPDQWKGQPGTRAPHIWITKEGEKLSTLDLFQKSWVLITANKKWKDAAEGQNLKIVSDNYLLGKDFIADDPQNFEELYGIGENGAILVRPDGFIAWKTKEFIGDEVKALSEVVKSAAQLKL